MLLPLLAPPNELQLRLLTEYKSIEDKSNGGCRIVKSLSNLYRRITNKRIKSNKRKRGDVVEAAINDKLLNEAKDAFNTTTRINHKLKKLDNAPKGVRVIELGGSIFDECKEIHYDPTISTRKFLVDGKVVPIKFHPTTNRTTKAKPRPQLDTNIMKLVNPYVIEPSTEEEDAKGNRRDIFKVTFPEEDKDGNEVVVYVMYAKKNSPCPVLRALHSAALGTNHKNLDNLIGQVTNKYYDDDRLAGGEYIPIGFGMEGHPEGYNGRPFTLKTLGEPEGIAINNIVAQIMHAAARAILEYFPLVYHSNQQLRANTNVACPSLSLQNKHCNWFVTQYRLVWALVVAIDGKKRKDQDNNLYVRTMCHIITIMVMLVLSIRFCTYHVEAQMELVVP